jgi:hypothetical protein
MHDAARLASKMMRDDQSRQFPHLARFVRH